MRISKKKRAAVIIIAVIALTAAAFIAVKGPEPIFKNWYSAEDFGIVEEKSPVDFNNNGVDDYADIVLGARKDAKNHPKYDGNYFENSFPPDNIGVCTDVVWRAFKNAGYGLREMVDRDIQQRPQDYPGVKSRDRNIDFRRVRNLLVFFERHAVSLTTDVEKTDQWQGGDIVIFDGDKHIGIVSDRRNNIGQPYVIHNAGQPNREEDYLNYGNVTAHFRFDASKVDKDILAEWSN